MALATVWLGTYGAMQQIRHPGRGFEIDPVKAVAVHELAGGGNVVDEAPTVARRYGIPYNALTDTQRDLMAAFHSRHFGAGPFAFVDPTVTNLLPANVQAAGMVFGRTEGFTPSGVTTVGYTATGGSLGFSAITWVIPSGTAGTKTLTVTGRDIPAITSTPLTFSLWVKASASTSTILRLSWRDAANAFVSNTDSTPTVGTAFARQSVSAATPPANAVRATLQVVLTTTPGSTLTYTMDGLQAEYTTLSGFQRSLGLPWVTVMASRQKVPFIGRADVDYELLEVA